MTSTGPPCKAFAAGYCPGGADCKLPHEIKIETCSKLFARYTRMNSLQKGKTRTANDNISQLPSREGSPCVPPFLALSAEPKREGVSMEHYPTIQDTHGGTSDDTQVFLREYQEPPSTGKQSNTKNGVSSQRRRTRSMSLPISPSILGVPHVSPT